ncbi:hypothetical protein [Chryseolinea soli]|uniref:Uncharacterized protein n=1 Tax=Chryseolinea soli TaxID=2321403 RepID=A0A385SIC6_9BACT|nr:hypothetical protein [Chryseolinea soli]AYB29110.1 hypothetical protein D4L85_00270 [Chryseolinea soli]
MKRKILYGICLLGWMAACKDEREERMVKLPVNVKASVSLYDQFGNYSSDALGGTSVAMKAGATPVADAVTDADGLCSLQATTGTYHFECSRNGYATVVTQPYQLLGGSNAYPVYTYLREVSTTRFEAVALSMFGGELTVIATVYHDYPYPILGGNYYPIEGIAFMSTSPDVSSTNYMQAMSFPVQVNSGETSMQSYYPSSIYFPSGSTIYVRVYGLAYNDYGTYDAQTLKRTYTTLGPASATAEILVP